MITVLSHLPPPETRGGRPLRERDLGQPCSPSDDATICSVPRAAGHSAPRPEGPAIAARSSARPGTAERWAPATWVLALGLGLATAIAHGLSSGGLREGIYTAVGAASVLAILAAALLHRPRHRASWLLIAAAQLLFGVGGLGLRKDLSLPVPAEILFVGAYLALIGALVLLVRNHAPRRDLATAIDTAIISTTLGVVVYAFLLAPAVSRTLTSSAGGVAFAYPLLDVMLLAAAVHLAFVPGRRAASMSLLGGALLALLAGDIVHTLQLVSTGSATPTLANRTWWMLSSALFGVAALHPSMTALSARASRADQGLSARRLGLLVATLLITPGRPSSRCSTAAPEHGLLLGGRWRWHCW